MPDHEAVNFQLNLSAVQRLPANQYHKVYQYHKANQLGIIKEEMERYKQAFLASNPYELTVEENWSNFKETVTKVMDTHSL